MRLALYGPLYTTAELLAKPKGAGHQLDGQGGKSLKG